MEYPRVATGKSAPVLDFSSSLTKLDEAGDVWERSQVLSRLH